MGYYTGQVFEIIHPDMSGSVAGGGRYDKLIGRSLGHDVPACGFSIGFERIVDLLSREQARDAVAVLVESDVPVTEALAVAREMRGASGFPGFPGQGGWSRRCGGAGSSAPSSSGWRRRGSVGSCSFGQKMARSCAGSRGRSGPRPECRWRGLASGHGHHPDSRSLAQRLVVG